MGSGPEIGYVIGGNWVEEGPEFRIRLMLSVGRHPGGPGMELSVWLWW